MKGFQISTTIMIIPHPLKMIHIPTPTKFATHLQNNSFIFLIKVIMERSLKLMSHAFLIVLFPLLYISLR
jgi:hypothetical protein